jgi:hypothetical protein
MDIKAKKAHGDISDIQDKHNKNFLNIVVKDNNYSTIDPTIHYLIAFNSIFKAVAFETLFALSKAMSNVFAS